MKFKFVLNKKINYGNAIYVNFNIKNHQNCNIIRLNWNENENWIKEVNILDYMNLKEQDIINENKSKYYEIEIEFFYFIDKYYDDKNLDKVNKKGKCSDILRTKITNLNSTSDNTLSILTFNIRYENEIDKENSWKYRKDIFNEYLQNLVNENKFDFICFQEVLYNQLHYIQNILPNYSFYCKGREDKNEDDLFKGEMCPIFYLHNNFDYVNGNTFWLSKTPNEMSCSFGNSIPRICTFANFRDKRENHENENKNKNDIIIYNTHLDHLSKNAQIEGIKLIKKEILKNYIKNSHIFLTGDFNFNPDPDFDGYKLALSYEFNLYDSCSEKSKSIITYHEFLGDKYKYNHHIDYVLYSENNKCVFYEINKETIKDKFPSDHYPIIVKFNLKT